MGRVFMVILFVDMWTSIAAIIFTFCMQMFGGYAELVYQFGMADEIQRDYIQKASDQAVQLITQGDFLGAFKVCGCG